MTWLPRTEAAPALGMALGTLDRLAAAGDLERKRCPDTGHYLYRVDDDEPEPAPARASSSREERDGYVYATDPDGSDHYVFTLRCHGGRSLLLGGDKVRAMWGAYTSGAQINEVARTFGLTRQEFVEIKTSLGLTKTSAPWPEEEIAERDEDDLVEDFVAQRTRAVLLAGERRSWAKIKRAAEAHFAGPAAIIEAIRAEEITPVVLPDSPHPHTEHIVILGLTDLHLGKRPHGGIDTPARQRERMIALCARAIESALQWGVPRRWYVHCGGDLLHADTAGYTTTKGTPQGGQHTGSLIQVWREAVELMAAVIERCAETAPVVVPVVPGNHDHVLAVTIGGALEQRFRDCKDITIDVSESTRRAYTEFDGVPILFHHGDSIKPRDAPALLASTVYGDVRRGVVFQGHLHRASHEESQGVDLITMPSPGPTCDWSHQHGYLSRKRLGVYRVTAAGLADTRLIEAKS